MESKIEKFDKHKEYRFEAELTTDIMAKIEEIIDHLNSQDQEEELHIENSGGKMFPVVGEIKAMSKKEWKEFIKYLN